MILSSNPAEMQGFVFFADPETSGAVYAKHRHCEEQKELIT
jgi:hypothetical protein